MKFIPCDLETNGLLDVVDKIHCLGVNWGGDIRVTSDYQKIDEFFSGDYYFVMHNGLMYDRVVVQKVLSLKVPYNKFIDTLAISWALYPKRGEHGLESWGREFNVLKPHIDDWENLTQEDYDHRVTEDVKIQTLLWEKIVTDLTELYGNDVTSKGEPMWLSYVKYLSFKMYTLSIQEKYPFKLDIPRCESNLLYLEGLKEERVNALKLAMPKSGVIQKKFKPKKCFKADGSHSSLGAAWFELLKSRGLPEDFDDCVEVIKSYDEPNPSSTTQVKDWLFSLGWEPMTFKAGANGEVPQLKNGDDLCESVKSLIKKEPSIEHLDKMGVLGHRIGLLKGFLRDGVDGYITAEAHGFTSTLRLRHKKIVNLVKVSAEYGEYIRSVFTCDDDYEICGADLASLEDRTKAHYIYDLDPVYVEKMSDKSYDPHLTLAVFDKALTDEQAQAHKDKTEDHSDIRHIYKQVVYMSTYGIGAPKLAKYLDIPVKKAKGLISAYRKLNWAVDIVANSFETKSALGRDWVFNPVSGFWLELRNKKDKFSAVNQSTGAYIFDMWIGFVLRKREQITLQMHDEGGWIIKKGNRPAMEKILRDSISMVNKCLTLNRDMDIDVKFGDNYAETH